MTPEKPAKPTRPQLNLLALFEHTDLPDEDWIEIRRMIARFFAERATEAADRIADEKGWTERRLSSHGTGPSAPYPVNSHVASGCPRHCSRD